MRSTIWLLTFVCSSLTLLCLTQAKKFSYKTEDDYRKGLLLQKKVIKIIKDIARREEEDSNVVVAPTPFPYFVRGKRDAPAGGERKKTGRKLVGIPDELRNFVEYEAIHYVDEETINSIDFTNKEAVKELKEFVAEQQKKNARYEFGYVVKDGISDSYLQRTEQRNGLLTTGSWESSDGFFKYKYSYEADENGFRLVSVDKTEIGDGPVQDKFGKAVVETLVGGVETQYAIQAQPVEEEEGAEERSGGDEAAQDKSGIRLVEVEPSSVLDGKQSASSIVFETKDIHRIGKRDHSLPFIRTLLCDSLAIITFLLGILHNFIASCPVILFLAPFLRQ